jgi:hypothetical protein
MAESAVTLRTALQQMEHSLGPSAPVYPGARIPTWRLATIAAAIIADAMKVDRIPVKGKRRGARKVAAARQYAMALVHLVTGRSQDDVAGCFQRNRTTASNHMEMVEWLNDVPEHEAFWEWAEQRYRLLVQLAELADGQSMWMQAVRGVVREWDEGGLEGAAHDQGKYIALTFWEERANG